MNRYITINGHILELSILLGIISLIVVSMITLLFFYYDFRKRNSSLRRKVALTLGFVLPLFIIWVLVFNDSLKLNHSPMPLFNLNQDLFTSSSLGEKQNFKFRYAISPNLAKLGFIKTVYDDGSRTYFILNSPTLPTTFIEDGNGDFIDQKDNIVIKTIPDHPFPVLIADRLASIWYLQFNSFVSHIDQIPVFKPSYDTRSVKVYYSDLYFTSLELIKDHFICNQLSLEQGGGSIPQIRHYFIFKNIRYYIDDCFADNSSVSPSN